MSRTRENGRGVTQTGSCTALILQEEGHQAEGVVAAVAVAAVVARFSVSVLRTYVLSIYTQCIRTCPCRFSSGPKEGACNFPSKFANKISKNLCPKNGESTLKCVEFEVKQQIFVRWSYMQTDDTMERKATADREASFSVRGSTSRGRHHTVTTGSSTWFTGSRGSCSRRRHVVTARARVPCPVIGCRQAERAWKASREWASGHYYLPTR